jgi:integrase
LSRYLVRHHGGYRFFRAIPRDLQQLEGRKAFSVYLGPLTPSEAKKRALELALEQERRAEALRQLSGPDRLLLISKGGLARCEADADYACYIAATLWVHSKPDANGRPTEHMPAVAAATQRAADVGAYIDKIVPEPITPDRDPKLFDLIPQWSTGIKAKEVKKMHQRVRNFAEKIGDLAPRDVTRAHTTRWRDTLYDLKDARTGKPCKLSTARKYLDSLHALFAVALSYGDVDGNPFSGLTVVDRAPIQKFHKKEKRHPFSADQLKLMLANTGTLTTPDDALVLRINIYNGTRGSEACQLRACDIVKVDGVHCIRITDEGTLSVKNSQSIRTVPLHPKVRDDVVALAARVTKEKGPDAPLFNYPRRPSDETYGGLFQQRMHRWLRERLKITDPNLTSHSTRHRFEDACHDAGLPEYVINRLVGHTKQKGAGARYGRGASVRVMAKWIAKVDPVKG